MNHKKYSVLMSVYFRENPEFFKSSIKSMLTQTIEPDEIVIVKDGKLTKELDAVIDNYVLKYPKIFTIICLENNIGLGLALNEGLKKCRNELVARMDTDDICPNERCELQIKEFAKNSKLEIVGTMMDEFYDNPNNIVSVRVVPTKHEDILKFSRRRSPFNHATVMYKKSSVLGCGGYRDIDRKEDIELFVRMLHKGCLTMNIDKSLYLCRANEGNFLRRKSWKNCKSYIDVIYSFWEKGYSTTFDLIVVIVGQVIMFISPVWVLKLLSNSFLRKKKNRV